jgi:ribonuclease HI
MAISFLSGGLAGSVLTNWIQHRKASRAEKKEDERKAKLIAFAQEKANKHERLFQQWVNAHPDAYIEGMTDDIAYEAQAAANAYRSAGDEVAALKWEARARLYQRRK